MEEVELEKPCVVIEEIARTPELVKILEDFFEDYVNNHRISIEMFVARLLILLGRDKGEVLLNLLHRNYDELAPIIEKCVEKIESSVSAYRVLGLIAKYHPLLFMATNRRMRPNSILDLRITPVRIDPLILRLEATLVSGKKIVLEMSLNNVREILNTIKAMNSQKLKEIFIDLFDEDDLDDEIPTEDVMNGGKGSEMLRNEVSSILHM